MIVRRQTKFVYFGKKMTLFIGKDRKAILKNTEEIAIAINNEEELLKLKNRFNCQTKVSEGDLVIIRDNPLTLALFWFGICLIILCHFVLSFDSNMLYWTTLLGIILMISSYFLSPIIWEKQKEV